MNKLPVIIFTIILFSTKSYSQIGYIEQYTDINTSMTNKLIETKDEGYMMLTTKNNSLYILCVDSLAKKNWDIELKYKGKITEGISHTKINDSTYLGLGKSEENIFVVNFDCNGDTVWSKLYGDLQNNNPCGIITTSDSSIYISGYNKNTYEQGFILKLNKQGDSIYYKTNDWSTTKNRFNSLIETENNENIIVVGQLNDDVYIAKYSHAGDTIWTKQYGGNSTDVGYSITRTNDNNFLIVGSSYIPGEAYTESYVLKINQHGDTIWTKKFGGDYYHDISYSIDSLSNNKFIITGEHNSVSGGVTYASYTIIDSDGDILSTQIYRTSENAMFYSATMASNNSYQILGKQGNNLLLIRTNNEGGFYTSLTYVDKPDFIIYPNPAENTINFKNLPSGLIKLEIYNVKGQLVISENIGSNLNEIDVSGLTTGVYMIKINNTDNLLTSRFIKK